MPENFFEIENVSFTAGGKNKVNNVNLSIENEGDIICLLGPSGIGKTTILRLSLIHISEPTRLSLI